MLESLPEFHKQRPPADTLQPIFSEEEIAKAFFNKTHGKEEAGNFDAGSETPLTPPHYRYFDQKGNLIRDKDEFPQASCFSNFTTHWDEDAFVGADNIYQTINGEKILMTSYIVPKNGELPDCDRILGNLIIPAEDPGSDTNEHVLQNWHLIQSKRIRSIEGIIVQQHRPRSSHPEAVILDFPNLEFIGGIDGCFKGYFPKLEVSNYLIRSRFPLMLPKLRWAGGDISFPGHHEILSQVGRKVMELPIPRPTFADAQHDVREAFTKWQKTERIVERICDPAVKPMEPPYEENLDQGRHLFDQWGRFANTNIEIEGIDEIPSTFQVTPTQMVKTLENGETVLLGSLILKMADSQTIERKESKTEPYLNEAVEIIVPYDYILGDVHIEIFDGQVYAPNLKKVGGDIRVDAALEMPELEEAGAVIIVGSHDCGLTAPKLKMVEGMLLSEWCWGLNVPNVEYVGSVDDRGHPLPLSKLKTIAGSASSYSENWYFPENIKHCHWVTSPEGYQAYIQRDAARKKLFKGNDKIEPLEI
jgi:hypothetical protein